MYMCAHRYVGVSLSVNVLDSSTLSNTPTCNLLRTGDSGEDNMSAQSTGS